MKVTVGDSGLCCCTGVLTPLFAVAVVFVWGGGGGGVVLDFCYCIL